MLRVAVLISGAGSNLRAFLDVATTPAYPVTVCAVGADRDAAGLQHAQAYDIPTFITPWLGSAERERWGEHLAEQLGVYQPDLIVLSGLMRLLPTNVLRAYPSRILNTHPAYLPEFPGAHGVRDALAAGVSETGASVILVDEGVDTGPILAQQRVPIFSGDDESQLHDRIKVVERQLLLDVVRNIATGALDLHTSPDSFSETP